MVSILICDDSEYIRKTISKIVQDLGHEVIGMASNGEEVVEMYVKLRPELVTLDVVMPKKHGIDALKDIISFDPLAQVIIVSAVTHEPLIKRGLELGALNFITKPFTINEFVNGISVVG